jgi:glutamate mutase epsilon subunit
MDLYHTTDVDGISLLNPDEQAMRELLDQLDAPGAGDAGHPDVSLVHDASAWSLSVFPGGTVTFENLEAEDLPPFYMNGVSQAEALRMWLQLSRGEIDALRARDWLRDVDA